MRYSNLVIFIVSVFVFAIFGHFLYVSYFADDEIETSELREVLTPHQSELKDRYIFIGDTGTGNENQYAVANAIRNYCDLKQDCAAVFILGDVIYPEGVVGINDIAFTEKFESPYKNIDLPFYILYGNHDYIGCRDCYLEYADRSENWKMPGRYYSLLSFGQADFYATDTENMDDEQLEWLSNELENGEQNFNIVIGHRPIASFEASKYSEDWSGRKELQDVICENADLYISGHSHLLEDVGNLDECNFIHLVSGAGGAYIRGIHEPFGGEFYHTGYGFLSLEVNEGTAIYEFINTNQEVIYNNKIDL